MDLLEYEGKELFSDHGISVPQAVLFEGKETRLPDAERVVVKAQIPAGKRKKYGGIKIVERKEALSIADEMMGQEMEGEKVRKVLLEAFADVEKELYISLSINRAGKNYHLVFSERGGSGVEEVAKEESGAVHILDFYEFDRERLLEEFSSHGFERAEEVVDVAGKMFELMREEDALLVEINPLAVDDAGKIIAMDSKVRIDENALYRHDFEKYRERDLESEAEKRGLEFVDLDGNIAVIGNGAGLVMATLDSINHFGGRPADFLDVGGGADFRKMEDAMELAMGQSKVDGLFVNIFGGITRCDEIAEGIIDFVERTGMEIPMVVRMVGTNQAKGRELLEENGIHALDSMDKCAEQIVELVESKDSTRSTETRRFQELVEGGDM